MYPSEWLMNTFWLIPRKTGSLYVIPYLPLTLYNRPSLTDDTVDLAIETVAWYAIDRCMDDPE